MQFLQFTLECKASMVNSLPQFQGVYLLLYSVDCQRAMPQGSCLRPCTKHSKCTIPRGWGPCHKLSAKYGECSHRFHKWKHPRPHWIYCDSWSAPQEPTVSLEHCTLFHPTKPILLDLQAMTTTTLLVLTTCPKKSRKKAARKLYYIPEMTVCFFFVFFKNTCDCSWINRTSLGMSNLQVKFKSKVSQW